MVGSGIFLLPAALASIGSIGLLGWIITAAGSILLAIIFGKLSQRLPLVGGLYAYCRHELGDFAGYQVSISYLLGNIIGDAATVIALLAYRVELQKRGKYELRIVIWCKSLTWVILSKS